MSFDDFIARTGTAGVTDGTGRVALALPTPTIDRLYAYSAPSHWGAFRAALPIGGVIRLDIESVSLTYRDALRYYYGASRYVPATGVSVGIIDTGVGPHADLNILSGRNTVSGEAASDFHDWNGHGTHVAGLVGAYSVSGTGLRGVAPNIELRAYRVFGAHSTGATNYSILKAMIFAGADGCDIINLSLGGGPYDTIVEEAIREKLQRTKLAHLNDAYAQAAVDPAFLAEMDSISALFDSTASDGLSSPSSAAR